MKINKLLNLIILAVVITILSSFTSLATTDIQFPIEYGPGFFSQYSEYSIEDVLLSDDNRFIIGFREVNVLKASDCDAEVATLSEELAPTSNRWGITLTEEERNILAQIVVLEAGNQCDAGQQAVIEVVLNRVVSPSFSNSVIGVLSQKGQFSTWKYRSKGRPDSRVYANIDAVLSGQTNILPFNTVFFSRKAQNKRVQTVIQDHVFCNSK